jgi:peptidyl-tRNA hydrolase
LDQPVTTTNNLWKYFGTHVAADGHALSAILLLHSETHLVDSGEYVALLFLDYEISETHLVVSGEHVALLFLDYEISY